MRDGETEKVHWVDAAAELVRNRAYRTNADAGAFTLTLPKSPTDGDTVEMELSNLRNLITMTATPHTFKGGGTTTGLQPSLNGAVSFDYQADKLTDHEEQIITDENGNEIDTGGAWRKYGPPALPLLDSNGDILTEHSAAKEWLVIR